MDIGPRPSKGGAQYPYLSGPGGQVQALGFARTHLYTRGIRGVNYVVVNTPHLYARAPARAYA